MQATEATTEATEAEQTLADSLGKTPAPFSPEEEPKASKYMEGTGRHLTTCLNQVKAKKSPRKDITHSEAPTDREHNTSVQTDCHQTLHSPARAGLSTREEYEGRNGISIHGPYCHGPRVLLILAGDAQEMGLKVS
ncbi:unnamed protein product [Amaranthus hypochondriacus]